MRSGNTLQRGICALILSAFVLLSGGNALSQGLPPQKEPLVALSGHLPPVIAQANAIAPTDAEEQVPLALTLPLRNEALLDEILTRLYDPNDPLYGHYLTSQQFRDNFAPTQADYNALAAFARAQGLSVTHSHSNRLLLNVSGPAAAVAQAFHVGLMRYRTANHTEFRAPTSEPQVPASIARVLSGVIGLDNAALWRPHGIRRNLSLLSLNPHTIGSGPFGGMSPSDIRTAYNLSGSTLTGAGQTLALFELDGFTQSDITTYENKFGLPNVPLQTVLVDNFSGQAGSGASEVTLDIELQIALASGVNKILIYEGPDTTSTGVVDTYNQIASDNLAKQISTSWGAPENQLSTSTLNSENAIFKQMAAQGQSLYAAAGDSGAYDDGFTLSVDDPASQPYVTGVGGTSLSTNGPGGSYLSETTWNAGSVRRGAGGGGISGFWPIPSYQSDLISTASLGSQTMRNVPDVSLNADPEAGYAIYFDGQWGVFGGTSCGSPLWAAFTALVNQQRTTNGAATLGFANLALYQIGDGTNYSSDFHDIADSSTNLFYPAVTGYDLATGLGSFVGANLLADLAVVPGAQTLPMIAAFTISPNPITGGYDPTGTVKLTGPAPAGGAVITLRSSNRSAVPINATVTVPAGMTSVSFLIGTNVVSSTASVTLTATSQNTVSTVLNVVPIPTIVSFTVSPNPITGGYNPTGTIQISQPAPPGGALVHLTSSNRGTVPIDATVTVLAGQTSVTFLIGTNEVSSVQTARLTATYNGTASITLNVVPIAALAAFTVSPNPIQGGYNPTGTVQLTQPAPPGGVLITFTSSDRAAVPIDGTQFIPAGQTSVTFPIGTNVIASTAVVRLTASYNGSSRATTLTVTP